MLVSTKSYFNYSCAHRQWKAKSHCAFIHGYDRSFHFWFACHETDETHFVMDFGDLKELKAFLDKNFDHTLLLNEDDPLMLDFQKLEEKGAARIVTMPNIGMEGTAEFVWTFINILLKVKTGGRVACFKVEVRENEKNSAYIEKFPEWFTLNLQQGAPLC